MKAGTRSGLVLIALLSTGCSVHGPDSMRVSRIAYNQAILESEQHELLLNLVRMRYSEAPEFLAVSGISTQMSFEGRAAMAGAFGRDAGDDTALVSPGVSVGYQENPTITFTPQRDEEFARQLMAPIEIDSLYLLSRQGWGIDRVLRLIADDLNGIGNATTREARTAAQIAELARFAGLAQNLRSLEQDGLIRIAMEQRQDLAAPHYVLELDGQARESPGFGEVSDLLGLPVEALTVDIDPSGGTRRAPSGTLSVSTRSVLGVLAYLSSGVDVPSAHLTRGLAAPDHAIETIQTLLTVGVATDLPGDVHAAVPYRGHWFFVDDGDLESKRTFSLLIALIRLSINAGGAQNVPILTLPVAR